MLDLEFEILYEISLSVGGTLDLDAALHAFMLKTVRLLDRSAGAVFRNGGAPAELPSIEYAIPRYFPSANELAALVDRVDLRDFSSSNDLVHVVDGLQRVYHCFPIPGYGALVLAGRPLSLSDRFLRHFRGVLHKLSAACEACELSREVVEKSRRLELATNAASIGTWEVDLRTDCLTLDARMQQLTGLRCDGPKLKLHDLCERIHLSDKPIVQAQLANYCAQALGEPIEFYFRMENSDQGWRRIASHAVQLMEGTTPVRLVAVSTDVTDIERARTESAYRSELESLLISFSVELVKQRYQDMDEATHAALGRIGEFVGADRAYRFSYDFQRDTVSNTHEWCAEGIEPEIHNLQHLPIREMRLWVTAHRAGLPFFVRSVSSLQEGHGLRRTLEPQGIKSLVTIPLMSNDECVGFIGLDAVRQERHWSDVDVSVLGLLGDLLVNADLRARSERLISEQHAELIEARNRAEQLALMANKANAAKSKIVARVSHELRTPLHAILGLTELFQPDSETEPVGHTMQTIRESAQYLLDIINDVLEFSRGESDELVITEADCVLAELLGWLERIFQPMAEKKGLRFSVHADAQILRVYRYDPLRLRQIVTNLLSNAVRFTREGSVRLEVEARGDLLVFSVRDTGVGIDEDEIGRLFDPFFQSSRNAGLTQSGSGLGLPISRMLANMMGGEIVVASERDKGSTFSLQIPMREAVGDGARDREQPVSPRNILPAGLRILVAEDNVINQELVKAFLRDEDCQVTCVNNGLDACAALSEPGAEYHILLLDCDMPVMDGFETALHIRSCPGEHQWIPIIAVTAGALDDQKAACLEAGMDDVLTKPFSRAALRDTLAVWSAGSRRPGMTGSEPQPTKPPATVD